MDLLSARRVLVQALDAIHRHPRRLTATVLGLLAGFAVTAFGIAPLAPDAADLPVRIVREELQVPGLAAQTGALAELDLQLNRTDVTRASDSADSLLRRLGVSDPLAAAFLRADRDARRLLDGSAGKMLQARVAADGTLLELVARFPALDAAQVSTHFTRLTLTRSGGRFGSRLDNAALVPQVRLGSGSIRSSLWAATDAARLSDAIASQLIEIFSGDIDFHRELRQGDSFSVAFEALTADDQPITWNDGTGRILAASFTNNGRQLQALWFPEADQGRGGYYGLDGKSRRHAFLASPMAFSRITSGFALRMHPILHSWRAHNGVDYGAPTGTPVLTVGDGVVESAGWMNGYGNVVQIRHDASKTTVYAHLSKMDVHAGQTVAQGQRVGLVGATGWATGPHLHFEFRVNGAYQDPLVVARATEALTLSASAMPRFQQVAAAARDQLATAQTLGSGFRGDAE